MADQFGQQLVVLQGGHPQHLPQAQVGHRLQPVDTHQGQEEV